MNARRSWFQLHLSTCVVMMFHAALMVGINTVCTTFVFPGETLQNVEYGIPFTVCQWPPGRANEMIWLPLGILGNLAALLFLLSASASLCELWHEGGRQRAGYLFFRIQVLWLFAVLFLFLLDQVKVASKGEFSAYEISLNKIIIFWIFFGLNLLLLPTLCKIYERFQAWQTKQVPK